MFLLHPCCWRKGGSSKDVQDAFFICVGFFFPPFSGAERSALRSALVFVVTSMSF